MLQTFMLQEYFENRLKHSNKQSENNENCMALCIIIFTAQETSLMWLHAGSYITTI